MKKVLLSMVALLMSTFTFAQVNGGPVRRFLSRKNVNSACSAFLTARTAALQ